MGPHVGYYVYEGAVHPDRAEYTYWHAQGLAGCVLRDHLRTRLKLPADLDAIQSLLFPAPQEGESIQ